MPPQTPNFVKILNGFLQQINPATEETLKSLVGFSIPEHDSIDITYVASGFGVGEIETVTYIKDASTVATLTLSYNAGNKLIGVVKS